MVYCLNGLVIILKVPFKLVAPPSHATYVCRLFSVGLVDSPTTIAAFQRGHTPHTLFKSVTPLSALP